MNIEFLKKFFQLELPVPNKQYNGGIDAKSDLKLILEIATNSRLKQGQDKKNEHKQIFYCRSLGKDCFKIQVEFNKDDGTYKLIDDYAQIRHKEGCEKSGQNPTVIKIYNLMMLKRQLIQDFMVQHKLLDSSPQAILQRISGDNGEYFYCTMVQDLESRRKLKKRFDNIINISIKKKKDNSNINYQQMEPQKNETFLPKTKGRKACKIYQLKVNKENMQNKKRKQIRHVKKQLTIKQLQLPFQRTRKRIKVQSNSSILNFKNYENSHENNAQDIKENIPSQDFQKIKDDSIFEQQQQDYFKKNSDMHIVLNKLNQAGSNNYWPESDNSIGQAVSDRLRIDDLFTSIRNSLLKSLERKSLAEIDHNGEGYHMESQNC